MLLLCAFCSLNSVFFMLLTFVEALFTNIWPTIDSVRVLPQKYNWAIDENERLAKKTLKRYAKMKPEELDAPKLDN